MTESRAPYTADIAAAIAALAVLFEAELTADTVAYMLRQARNWQPTARLSATAWRAVFAACAERAEEVAGG